MTNLSNGSKRSMVKLDKSKKQEKNSLISRNDLSSLASWGFIRLAKISLNCLLLNALTSVETDCSVEDLGQYEPENHCEDEGSDNDHSPLLALVLQVFQPHIVYLLLSF